MTFNPFKNQPHPNLDALLEQAKAHGPMTSEEIETQRQSWVKGEMGLGNDTDEAAYRAALESGNIETLTKLDLDNAQRAEAVKSDKTLKFLFQDLALQRLKEIKRLGRFKTLEDALAASLSNEYFRLCREAKGEKTIIIKGAHFYHVKWIKGDTFE